MIVCKNCGEYLDDGADVCCFCKRRVSKQDKENADRIAKACQPIVNAVTEYKKRTRNGIILIVCSVFLLIVIALIITRFELPYRVMVAVGILWLIGSAVGLILTKYKTCPWCGAVRAEAYGRNMETEIVYCRFCGKELRMCREDLDKMMDPTKLE